MKKLLLIIISYILPAAVFSQSSIEGTYTGLEKICWSTSRKGECINYDVKNPDRRWYYDNIFRFKKDSVLLVQRYASIHGKDTLIENSCRTKLYYAGTFIVKDDKISISLFSGETKKQYSGKLTTEGIIIQQYLYKKRLN